MRVVPVDASVIGERLGHAIKDRAGRTLLSAGVKLTAKQVEQLRRRGYRSVPVGDPLVSDLMPTHAIREETHEIAQQAIERTFEQVGLTRRIDVGSVRSVVDQIINDLAVNPDLAYNVTCLRSVDEAVFEHSIYVCVYSVMLAGSLALARPDLRNVGVGALLHDIGKIYYLDLVHKPGKLTPDEFEAVKQHTRDGYELLRHQPGIHLFSTHIAFQHHELLDGSGYPRGLYAERILPWAQIVAVADIYDTVCADRPYALGLPPDAAIDELKRMAERGQLAEQHVRHLSYRVAAYPVGTLLLLESGEVAVVVAQTAQGGAVPRATVVTDPNLILCDPSDRVIDGHGAETAIRAVLQNYPERVREQLARSDPASLRLQASTGRPDTAPVLLEAVW